MTLPESWGRSLVTIECGYYLDSITFLDHGKLLATSGYYTSSPGLASDQGLDIWDPRTGDCPSNSLPIGRMKTICLSPDGSLVVSVSREEVLTLWDVARRENRFDWENRQSRITKTTFSFDSRHLALGNQDGSVRVVDTQTGTDHWNLKDHPNEVTNLEFSPDATILAIGVLGETIRLWNVRSGSHHSTLGDRVVGFDTSGNAGPILVFSPDSRSIATSFGDPTVQLWSTPTGKYRFELDGYLEQTPVSQVRFSPNSELLATRSNYANEVFIWDVHTGTCLFELFGHYQDFSFSPNSKSLALGSSLKVEVWDIQKQTCNVSLDSDAWRVCFSPDGKFLASGSDDGTVRVWEIDSMPVDDCSVGSPSEPANEDIDGEICGVGFSPDGKFVASRSSSTVRIWQSKTGDCCFGYKGHDTSFSSDGRMVISVSEDGLRLFDVGAKTSQFSPTQDYVRFPSLSPDGRLVAAIFMDSIQVWDIQESTIISLPIRDCDGIHELIFSPTSDFIALELVMEGPRVWDARTGECITDLTRWPGDPGFLALAFSPHSELLAFGRNDDQGDFYLRLWDIQADACRITLESNGRCGHAKAIIFAPEGHFVAVSFWDHDPNVRLWNSETGDLLLTIPCFSLMPRVDFLIGMDVVFIDGIGREIVQSSESRGPAIADRSCHISSLQIDDSGQWVTRSSERVLWLPPERRSNYNTTYAVWRNKIAIGCLGGLLILTFDDEPSHSGIEELSLGSDD